MLTRGLIYLYFTSSNQAKTYRPTRDIYFSIWYADATDKLAGSDGEWRTCLFVGVITADVQSHRAARGSAAVASTPRSTIVVIVVVSLVAV